MGEGGGMGEGRRYGDEVEFCMLLIMYRKVWSCEQWSEKLC